MSSLTLPKKRVVKLWFMLFSLTGKQPLSEINPKQSTSSLQISAASENQEGDGKGVGKAMPVSDVPRSAGEIHLPQLLNEEAIADEFSKWEQVSSLAAECLRSQA
ncbi:MAG: hypothetical protein ACLRMZ_06510 [Blautia marasmi]